MPKVKKTFKFIIIFAIIVILAVGLFTVAINVSMVNKEKANVVAQVQGREEGDTQLSQEEITALKAKNPDCIMVLGCGIVDYETPTPMLKDRLEVAVALYQQGIAPKILLTGDNGSVSHNEIHVMLTYVKNAGVPKKDIFCDHAGFSTYDSMYRAESIFQAKSMVVVTQSYHLYRSLYIADSLGLTVTGVAADQERYSGQFARDGREVLARVKDYVQCVRKPEATLGGDVIPITGSGVSSQGE